MYAIHHCSDCTSESGTCDETLSQRAVYHKYLGSKASEFRLSRNSQQKQPNEAANAKIRTCVPRLLLAILLKCTLAVAHPYRSRSRLWSANMYPWIARLIRQRDRTMGFNNEIFNSDCSRTLRIASIKDSTIVDNDGRITSMPDPTTSDSVDSCDPSTSCSTSFDILFSLRVVASNVKIVEVQSARNVVAEFAYTRE
jgi:hypothetical protein